MDIYAQAAASRRQPVGDLTVQQAVDAFVGRKVDRELWCELSRVWYRRELDRFALLGRDVPIADVDSTWLYRYLDAVAELAVASRKTRWAAVVEWLTWCVRRGWITVHPVLGFDDDDLPWRGRRGKAALQSGKAQLRNAAECDAYIVAALQLPTPEERVGALLPLSCGMRSGEVRHLRVADVDFRADRLWIRAAGAADPNGVVWTPKSASSVRTVALPAELLPDLVVMTRDRRGDAWLLGTEPPTYKWLLRAVAVACDRARVSGGEIAKVTPHGLRGTYATMAAQAGHTPADIAALLGHADRGQTAMGHYVAAPVHTPGLRLVQGGRG
jgi:integrase